MSDVDRPVNDFAWTTGEPFTYRSWYMGEPNNAPVDSMREDCGEQQSAALGGWNDRICGLSSAYICERERWPNW